MQLVFLYGLPATGKLTVGQILAERTGFRLFHNHLAVDLLLPIFDFGSPSFVDLREEIWISVFRNASASNLPGLVFTFAPEKTVRPDFIDRTLATVTTAGGQVHFVELTCPLPELGRRVSSPSRLRFRKLTSPRLFDQLHASGALDTSHMPRPSLTLDTSLLTPGAAADQIISALRLPCS